MIHSSFDQIRFRTHRPSWVQLHNVTRAPTIGLPLIRLSAAPLPPPTQRNCIMCTRVPTTGLLFIRLSAAPLPHPTQRLTSTRRDTDPPREGPRTKTRLNPRRICGWRHKSANKWELQAESACVVHLRIDRFKLNLNFVIYAWVLTQWRFVGHPWGTSAGVFFSNFWAS